MILRATQIILLLGMLLMSVQALAGQPSVDSPEPNYWALMALGVLPLVYVFYRHLRRQMVSVSESKRRSE